MKKPELVGIMWKCRCGALNAGRRTFCGRCDDRQSTVNRLIKEISNNI